MMLREVFISFRGAEYGQVETSLFSFKPLVRRNNFTSTAAAVVRTKRELNQLDCPCAVVTTWFHRTDRYGSLIFFSGVLFPDSVKEQVVNIIGFVDHLSLLQLFSSVLAA